MDERVPGFETTGALDLPEYSSRAYLYSHARSGCEVLHLSNDDEERAFGFAFRTPPEDPRGIPHMLEHLALSGSRKYRGKDPFVELAKGSLATFMNAVTRPDSTIYPAASAVMADFGTLFDVYADAVFAPLLERGDFLSECVRLVPGEPTPTADGVIYNEMRGSYEGAEARIELATMKALAGEGHPYSFDPGGEPDFIPEATLEDVRAFHERHYRPDNSLVYLYGKLDPRDYLAKLAEEHLSRFERGSTPRMIPPCSPPRTPTNVTFTYRVSGASDSVAHALVSWLGPETASVDAALDFEILAWILAGSDGAPLTRGLLASRLGELSPLSGLSTSRRETIFSFGARGCSDGSALASMLDDRIRESCDKGFDPALSEAAFNAIELAVREKSHGGSSWGLRPLFRALRGWLHGAGAFATISPVSAFEEAKRNYSGDPRRFERRARELLLDNPRRVAVTAVPESGRTFDGGRIPSSDGRARERAKLDMNDFLAWEADPRPAVAIPRVARSDLPAEPSRIEREVMRFGRFEGIHTPARTDGIAYLDLCVPIDVPADPLSDPVAAWYPLFARCAASVGRGQADWADSATEQARLSGGFWASLTGGTARDGTVKAWIRYGMRALESRLESALPLFLETVLSPRLSDSSRVLDLAREYLDDSRDVLPGAGQHFAHKRAAACLTRAASLDEAWGGLAQLAFVRSIRDLPGEILSSALSELHASTVGRAEFSVHVTGSSRAAAIVRRAVESILPRRGGESVSADAGAASSRSPDPSRFPLTARPSFARVDPARSERIVVDSDVGFACVASEGIGIGHPRYGLACVLAHWLRTGPLWKRSRGSGGAYGVSCSMDPLEAIASLSSDRDPDCSASARTFLRAFLLEDGKPSESECDAAVAGSVGGDSRPLSPEDSGAIDFRRAMFGVTYEDLRMKRESQLSATATSLVSIAEELAARAEARSRAVLISGPHGVESTGLGPFVTHDAR